MKAVYHSATLLEFRAALDTLGELEADEAAPRLAWICARLMPEGGWKTLTFLGYDLAPTAAIADDLEAAFGRRPA